MNSGFQTMLIAIVLTQAVIFACFCSYVASQKNRAAKLWFFLGFLFGPIALLALIGIPVLDGSVPSPKLKNKSQFETNTMEVDKLIKAVIDNDRRLVEELLERGADPHEKNEHGQSPFQFAVGRNNSELVKLFRSLQAEG